MTAGGLALPARRWSTSRMSQLWCGGSVLALTLALATSAWAAEPDASTRAVARKIATDGVAALQDGDAELASQKLEKAFELLPAPSIALWSARALIKRGKLVEASERLLLIGRLPPSEGNEQAVQAQAQKDAARELADLTQRIPKLVITLDSAQPSEVSLSLDGKTLSSALLGEEQPANPGTHSVRGTRGAEQAEQTVNLVETQKAQVVLHFRAPAPGSASGAAPAGAAPPVTGQAPSPAAALAPTPPAVDGESRGSGKTLAFVALAVGGAGLITGGVTGLVALSKHSDLTNNPACMDGKCPPSLQGDVDSFRTMRTVSSIGFIAGGVFAATGVVLLLTTGSSSQKGERASPELALQLAPGNVSVTGSF
jgi:hypothetical protein